MISKSYIKVCDKDTLQSMYNHILANDILAVDTETNSLNPRKGIIVGWSVSGQEGVGYYFPTFAWNKEAQTLDALSIEGTSCETLSKRLIKLLLDKKLVFHNASFDVRFIKNYYGIDLLSSVWVDTGMLVHTVQEEGAFGYGSPFALKSIAMMNQKELGLNIEEAANKEQLALKESVKNNGGSTTKDNFEIYKADMDILSEYGAADTDLTLRICNLYLDRLREEGLWDFFFEEEVMPVYKEVTIPMEDFGVALDIPLILDTKDKIEKDLEIYKNKVSKGLMSTTEAKSWVIRTAIDTYKCSNKGSFVQEFCKRYEIPLPISEKTGKFSITTKSISALDDSPYKTFLQSGDTSGLDKDDLSRISLKMWKDANGGDYININSKKQLGEVVFKYMGVEPLSKTDKGADQFNSDLIEHISKDFEWAKDLHIYNKLLKIKSTYIERFLEGQEDGRYYPYFKQNGTISGRYGSDLQQLPKPMEEDDDDPIILKYNNLIRAFFIAGQGRKLIDSDYCLHPDTELLTKRGWIKVLDIEDTDIVWQVDKDTLAGSWCKPSRIIKRDYDGLMRRFDELRVTQNHTMVWYNKNGESFVCLSQEKPPKGFKYLATEKNLLEVSFIEAQTYLGKVGCVTVDTGFILVRSGGQTFVTGNCALEPTTFASVSGETEIQAIFKNDWDFYSTIAIRTEKLDQDIKKYPNGVSGDTKSPVYLKKLDPSKRQKAKAYCFVGDTLVSTPQGPKKIKELVLGDLVSTPQGPKKILSLFKRVSNVIGLKTSKGYLKCTEDHKIKIGDRWVEAINTSIKDQIEIEKEPSCNEESVNLPINSNMSFRNGGSIPLGYLHLDKNWSYYIGAIIGDGIISISNKDNKVGHGLKGYVGICGLLGDGVVDWVLDFHKTLGYACRELKSTKERSKDYKAYITTNSELCKIVYDTLKLGNLSDKIRKKNLEVPEYIFRTSKENKYCFLAGLFDTDGYIKESTKSMNLCTKDIRLANGVLLLLSQLGVDASFGYSWNKAYKRDYYIIRVSKRGMITLKNEGFSRYMKCHRKAEQLNLVDDSLSNCREIKNEIKGIDFLKEECDVYDITVEDAHCFYANGILVHNCLGIPYGMGAYALHKAIDVSKQEAESLVRGYLEGFPRLAKWMEDTREFAKKNGYVQNKVGRKRHLPTVKALYNAFGDKLLDWRERERLSYQYSSKDIIDWHKDYKNGLNNSINFLIQSLAASIVNRSALKINRKAKELGIDARVQAQIHDQLIINIEEDKAEEFAPYVQSIMENIIQLEGVELKAPPSLSFNFRDGH